MAGSMEKPVLHVEGRDDKHSVKQLLIRHGIRYDLTPPPAGLPLVQEAGGVDELVAEVPLAVQLGTGLAVGFVLDADSPLSDRWQSVRGQLARVGVEAPERPPAEGFIGDSPPYRTRVGVWLMPDNQHDGKLETLLRSLISEGDALIVHAECSTDKAKSLGARFAGPDRVKAVVHAWLAWQEEPGLPYGTAIRARFLRHDSPAAGAFVSWFKRLYGIS